MDIRIVISLYVVKHENIKLEAAIDDLMEKDHIQNVLGNTDVLVAPHHGRDESFNSDFVELVNPDLVIFSDKGGVNNTATSSYAGIANGKDVERDGSDESTERFVVTTRSDGRIRIEANNNDDWKVSVSGRDYAEAVANSRKYTSIGKYD